MYVAQVSQKEFEIKTIKTMVLGYWEFTLLQKHNYSFCLRNKGSMDMTYSYLRSLCVLQICKRSNVDYFAQ